MLGNTRRNLALLAGAAGLNLLLGVAVASGVVPQAGGSVSVASQQPAVADDVTSPPVVAVAEAGVTADGPQETDPPKTAPPATSPPTTKAHAGGGEAAAETEPAPAAAPMAAPALPQSSAVPRVNPPSFEVFQAIQQLALRIPLFKPTEAQAREFGDMVCTAFDQGKSYAEVKAGVIAAVSQVPGLSVSSSDADFAIRTAVELFCPGHKSKLA